MVERLKAIGINPIIKDEGESGRLADFGTPIHGFQDLYVQEDEKDKALPIIEEVKLRIEKN